MCTTQQKCMYSEVHEGSNAIVLLAGLMVAFLKLKYSVRVNSRRSSISFVSRGSRNIFQILVQNVSIEWIEISLRYLREFWQLLDCCVSKYDGNPHSYFKTEKALLEMGLPVFDLLPQDHSSYAHIRIFCHIWVDNTSKAEEKPEKTIQILLLLNGTLPYFGGK